MRGNDVDRLQLGREVWVSGEGGEIQDEEDEAVFSAIVGEGEGGDSGQMRGGQSDVQKHRGELMIPAG